MYVSDHQGGDLSDIIRSAGHTNQPETDTWKIPESIEQLPTDIKFDTVIDDSLLSSCFESVPEKSNVESEMMIDKPTGNIFSRVLQVSPVKPLPMVVGVDGDRTVRTDRVVQMSSPRVPPGVIKRRKSLAKKVVCIPAPAAASSSGSSNRPSSGEVVPSDLWAWRKYGQKPIKGSPFPRGYYRCSSSKGCSARKQVERSRTDPNMLVITYTSEHNHPWPTQRNVLAGSTRSTYPSKTQRPNSNSNLNVVGDSKSTNTLPGIKEEVSNMNLENNDKLKFYSANTAKYTTELSDDHLFADLAELESDPMSLIFEKTEHEDIDKSSFCNVFDWGESSLASLTEDCSKKNLQY